MSVVIFRTHQNTAYSRFALEKLRKDLPQHKIYVLAYLTEPLALEGALEGAVTYSPKAIRTLPYPDRLKTFDEYNLYSACDLPLLKLLYDIPPYDFYWIIEFDVMYTGNWKDLFGVLQRSRADLLGTTICRQSDMPDWVHWPSLRLRGEILPLRQCVKGFLPFARLSHAAFKAIDEMYMQGLNGHFEAAWPTACLMRGLRIQDIGGHGPFTPWRWRGKHYVNAPQSGHLCPGTFIYRPAYSRLDVQQSNQPPLLWHPVKS